jgi:hypothetical protein
MLVRIPLSLELIGGTSVWAKTVMGMAKNNRTPIIPERSRLVWIYISIYVCVYVNDSIRS